MDESPHSDTLVINRLFEPDEGLLSLLLVADPSESVVRSYLNGGKAFVGRIADLKVVAAVLVVKGNTWELKNISVAPGHHRNGYGRRMINHLADYAKNNGASSLLAGTGNSSAGPLAFYKSLGFETIGTVKDYFADYEPPIFENGVRCLDLIQLECRLR